MHIEWLYLKGVVLKSTASPCSVYFTYNVSERGDNKEQSSKYEIYETLTNRKIWSYQIT